MNTKDSKKKESFGYVVKLGNLFVCSHTWYSEDLEVLNLHKNSRYAEEFDSLKEAIKISNKINGQIFNKIEVITTSYKYEEVLIF